MLHIHIFAVVVTAFVAATIVALGGTGVWALVGLLGLGDLLLYTGLAGTAAVAVWASIRTYASVIVVESRLSEGLEPDGDRPLQEDEDSGPDKPPAPVEPPPLRRAA